MTTHRAWILVFGLLAIAAGAAFVGQRHVTGMLQDELTRLREDKRELARLRAENQRLAAAQVSEAELQRLRSDHAALARLRREIDELRERTERAGNQSAGAGGARP